MTIEERLFENAKATEAYLREIYAQKNDRDTATLIDAEKYSVFAGGKRIRPFLTLEFCRLFGGKAEAALPFAAAVELMHTFSLIHDDLPCMDDDDLRRGRSTSHKVFGEATALLAGDSLALRAVQTALENKFVSAADARRAALAVCQAAGADGMIGGQIIDMRGEKEALDFQTLLKLHGKKTTEMIKLSAALGCIAAGLPEGDAGYAASKKYAEGIGLAFQIIDDLLDSDSSEEELGKSVGGDAARGKTTFLSFMDREHAMAYAAELTEAAKSALPQVDDADVLRSFADYLLARKK